ncbi:MAG: hypothetical protein D6797_06070 [Bdellovibrio sp.]|nr:MAG: hypothetical protein D6797_06070 [Bdellovibrio sp.]
MKQAVLTKKVKHLETTEISVKLFIFLFVFLPFSLWAHQGQQVFKLCAACHGPHGEGKPDIEVPQIAGLPSWYVKKQLVKFKKGVRGKHPQDIAGMRMAPMARTLKDKDIEVVAEYVASLKPSSHKEEVSGDKANGQAKFATCMACHGPKAQGNQAIGAPPLVHLDAWYIKKQIKNFQKGIRGRDASKDPEGAQMAPMAATLSGDKDIQDVIFYIKSL